jgi:hypothetical protein
LPSASNAVKSGTSSASPVQFAHSIVTYLHYGVPN